MHTQTMAFLANAERYIKDFKEVAVLSFGIGTILATTMPPELTTTAYPLGIAISVMDTVYLNGCIRVFRAPVVISSIGAVMYHAYA